jgi:hypothetical protein
MHRSQVCQFSPLTDFQFNLCLNDVPQSCMSSLAIFMAHDGKKVSNLFHYSFLKTIEVNYDSGDLVTLNVSLYGVKLNSRRSCA